VFFSISRKDAIRGTRIDLHYFKKGDIYMKRLGRAAVLTFLCLFLSNAAFAGPWLNNYQDALAQAKQRDKPILVVFAGEGWCPGCIAMEKDIFKKPDFLKYAADNLVLLKVNCINGKAWPKAGPCSTNLVPSCFLVGPGGKIWAKRIGYSGKGSPDGFIKWVTSKEDIHENGGSPGKSS
jgi:protein disulfide-isomerase